MKLRELRDTDMDLKTKLRLVALSEGRQSVKEKDMSVYCFILVIAIIIFGKQIVEFICR